MTLLWRLLADWCLSYEGGTSVLYGMWLTEGDDWPHILDLTGRVAPEHVAEFNRVMRYGPPDPRHDEFDLGGYQ